MSVLEKIKLKIAEEINKALGKNIIQASDLIFPPSYAKASAGKPNPEMGDLSLACFSLAKNAGKNPAELASFLVGKLKDGLSKEISSVKAMGPYLNFVLNKDYLAENVLMEIGKEKNKYGENKIGVKKKVMIEYSNANTHKEYHVGHLRNIAYGDAVNRILAANGYKIFPVSYINDFGIHVAKTLWALETIYNNKIEEKENKPSSASSFAKAMEDKKATEDKGYFLGKVYVSANEAMEKNETAKGLVSFMMKKIESRKGEEYKLWQKTREWSIEYMDKIYKELGVKFSHIFYESEVIDKGKKMIGDLLKKGFLIKSQGAVIADLEKYGLGVLVFLRSDGTALYPVADIPLAIEKLKKYKLDKSIYVVDIRQGQYFKQLFKIMELLGYRQEMAHLGYEFVKLPSGMMSSRSGNVITYEDLKTQLTEKAVGETKKRHENWSDKKINKTVLAIINGAIKFEMIKVGREQIITFDIDTALRFDGFTAAYLQYTFARIQSIARKSNLACRQAGVVKSIKSKVYPIKSGSPSEIPEGSEANFTGQASAEQFNRVNFKNLTEKQERELIIKLAKYPEIVLKAGENCDPSEIAKYLFELAQEFNNYYHNTPILKTEEKIMAARLVLISAVSGIIKNGLGLLGIETVEEM